MVDIKRLINHYEMGVPYYGDVTMDTIETLKMVPADESYCQIEEIKSSQFDETDFEDIIDLIQNMIKSKQNKSDLLSDLSKLAEIVECKNMELINRSEYVLDQIKSLKKELRIE